MLRLPLSQIGYLCTYQSKKDFLECLDWEISCHTISWSSIDIAINSQIMPNLLVPSGIWLKDEIRCYYRKIKIWTSLSLQISLCHQLAKYCFSILDCEHGPLTRYVRLRVAHAPEFRERLPRQRFQRKPLVNDLGMHHGTCVTHVPWCMSGSLTCGGGENVPDIPGACAPAILRIWQEAHVFANIFKMADEIWRNLASLRTCRTCDTKGHNESKQLLLMVFCYNYDATLFCAILLRCSGRNQYIQCLLCHIEVSLWW